MTRFSRVLATPLMSAVIFGATFGMAGTAIAANPGGGPTTTPDIRTLDSSNQFRALRTAPAPIPYFATTARPSL